MKKQPITARIFRFFMALVMFFTIPTFATAFASAASTVTYVPAESDAVLSNPYMGWVPWAFSTSHSQPFTMVYAPILWSDLEPTQGTFDWASFETKNHFDYWRSKGVKINIRFYMDQPTGTAHRDIPDWLYNAMGTNKGTAYDTTSIGKGFSPNYSDPVLIAEHAKAIQALGARYNNDPLIAFIQLGSLGHWGEWHTYGTNSVFPPMSVSDQYVQHYLNAFSSDKLVMRRGYKLAGDNGMGLFNDVFGEQLSLEAAGWGWINQINKGYYDGLNQFNPAMPNFWQAGPSGGEFAYGDPARYLTSTTIDETIRQAQVSHTSWLGPSTPADIPVGGSNQPYIDALAKTMGYRFVLSSVTHSDTAVAGNNFSLNMTWNNKGVAPFYFNWPLRVGLADANGIVTYTTTNDDIRNWLPGTTDVIASMSLPSNIPAGTYSIVVSIADPATDKPGINLAIDGKRTDGWYALDTVNVVSTVTEPVATQPVATEPVVTEPVVSGSAVTAPITSDTTTTTTTETITAPVVAAPATTGYTIDGNASDWASVTPVYTASNQSITSIKVAEDANNVYALVEGTNLGTNGELFIDADGNKATGYYDKSWTESGFDYLIEGGHLYNHPTADSTWAWTALGTSAVEKAYNGSAYEFRIAKSALSGIGTSYKVGFKDLNSSWALVSKLPLYASTTSTTTAPSTSTSTSTTTTTSPTTTTTTDTSTITSPTTTTTTTTDTSTTTTTTKRKGKR